LVPENPKKKMAVKFPADVHLDYLEMCYPPILQSGGQYSLRPSASSNSETIHFGAIVCSLGVRYKSYCSNIGRTFLIAPTEAQESNYKFLVALQQHIIALIRPGIALRHIYEQATEYVREKRPDLSSHFVANAGFSMGLEFRESDYVIHAKNEREIKQGMVFNVAIGFQDLVNEAATEERGKIYALFLADTVTIGKAENQILTDGLKRLEDISFVFKDQQGEDDRSEGEAKQGRTKKSRHLEGADQDGPEPAGGRVIKTRLRSQAGKTLIDTAALKKREAHQKVLLAERIREGLSAAAGLDDSAEAGGNKSGGAESRLIESYRKEAFLPSAAEIKALKIYVDKRAESVLFPICGLSVPFHISTIKNVSKSDEGEFMYLRVNFQLPAKSSATAPQQVVPGSEPALHYIRSLTFRSTDTHHMGQVYKELTELRKLVAAKETEKKQMADLVEQESLIEIKAATHQGKRAIRLPDVYMRPALEGKRVPGDLEIHANGIRYRNMLKGDLKTDILFSNMKHLFFQPCDSELIILIHCHLKHPILIGKKKTKDVQFYREASDAIVDDTVAGRGPRGGKYPPMRQSILKYGMTCLWIQCHCPL
jgi:nucleosome binding factor SPN SPT16 subunit